MPTRSHVSALDKVSDAEAWHVQYILDTQQHVAMHPTPEAAIEAACRLMDAGHYVYGVGVGPLSDSIGPKEIARIYALWASAKNLLANRYETSRVPSSSGRHCCGGG
jgi:hypothetical protein